MIRSPLFSLGSSLSAAAATLLLLCNGALAFERPEDGVYKDRVDWGLTADLSGPVAAAQLPFYNGVQAYIKMVNDAGSIHGRKINLLGEDTRYDPTNERIAYEKFLSQTPALAISGWGISSAQVALAPLLKRNNLPVVGSFTSANVSIDPPNPNFYGAYCGFKEMAQTGIGYFVDRLKLQNAKIAVVHLDIASGKEFAGFVESYVAGTGATVKLIPIKVVTADATPQVLEIINMKPDFVAIHGVPTTAILIMKGLQQHGLNIPAFGITFLGGPAVFQDMGSDAGKNYNFVSCFTPASSDEKASAQLVAAAKKYGYEAYTDDVNFVSGWIVGQLIAESLQKVGPEPTREKLRTMLNAGVDIDTKGLSAPLKYTPTDHKGLQLLKVLGYDYEAKKYKSFGDYSDYAKYMK